MLRWSFAALTLAAFTAPAQAGLCSHGKDTHHAPSCAAPCDTCAPAGPSCAAPCDTCAPAEPTCAVPAATCDTCAPAAPTCCAPAAPSCAAPAVCDTCAAEPSCCAPAAPCSTCAPAEPTCAVPAATCDTCVAEPSCAVPAECGTCDGGCHTHTHCAPKKKSCLSRLWDAEKRKNRCLKDRFLGWMN